MKMSDNPAKYEVLIEQYLRSILDISVRSADEKHLMRFQSEKRNTLTPTKRFRKGNGPLVTPFMLSKMVVRVSKT